MGKQRKSTKNKAVTTVVVVVVVVVDVVVAIVVITNQKQGKTMHGRHRCRHGGRHSCCRLNLQTPRFAKDKAAMLMAEWEALSTHLDLATG